jgi:hypothetical protein
MPYRHVGAENSGPIELYYEDHSLPPESAPMSLSRAADWWWWRAGRTARPGPTPSTSTVCYWAFSDRDMNRHSEFR